MIMTPEERTDNTAVKYYGISVEIAISGQRGETLT